MLCMNHPQLPMELWCSLISQSEMTLSMVRQCISNPLIPACAALEGELNNLGAPLAPLGSLAMASTTPSQRESYATHSASTWFISPEMKHCRWLLLRAPETKGAVTSDVLRWSETSMLRLPITTTEEQEINASLNFSQAMRKNLHFLA